MKIIECHCNRKYLVIVVVIAMGISFVNGFAMPIKFVEINCVCGTVRRTCLKGFIHYHTGTIERRGSIGLIRQIDTSEASSRQTLEKNSSYHQIKINKSKTSLKCFIHYHTGTIERRNL